MADQFTEKITVKDEWVKQGEKFRLVDKGAGPLELQILDAYNAEYRKEREHYTHSILCARILDLCKSCDEKRTALNDALSAFNNEEGKTTIVNEERLEAWERALEM